MTYNSRGMSVVVCSDLSGKGLQRQVGGGRVVTSGSLTGIMVGRLALNARDEGLIPALGARHPIFIALTTSSGGRMSRVCLPLWKIRESEGHRFKSGPHHFRTLVKSNQ